MNTTIAHVVFLAVGYASAFILLRATTGAFSPHKAEGARILLALSLCFVGGWFTIAKPDGAFHFIDLIVLAVLIALAAVALRYPSIL